jgi:hypothetical protein
MSQSYVNATNLYAPLGAYNVRPAGTLRVPFAIPGTLADIRLQPEFGSCGNMALSNGLGNASMNDGYFNLCNAYPNCGDSCTKYVRQLCPGQVTNLGGYNPVSRK